MALGRMKIQEFLETLIESKNVYFQPPENVKMKYPCVVYRLSSTDDRYADNIKYRYTKRYDVTLITKNPEDWRIECLLKLPMSALNRSYSVDYLNHYVFSLYY